MSIVVIVNPAAGGGRAAKRAKDLCAQLPGADIVSTEGPGHATTLAREAKASGARVVVAAGGDGTTFEVVNGLLPGPGPALGVLAIGTGNSFPRDVGLADPARAVEAILRGSRRRVDAVRIRHAGGELWSVNLVSLGFTAEVGELTNRRFKAFGAAGYVAAVVGCLAKLQARPFPFALDGGPFDGRPLAMLSVCNSGFTGGSMHMAPAADPGDGLVDVIRIAPMGRRRLLSSFPRIFQGTHTDMAEVASHRASVVTFAPIGPVPVLVDGEMLSLELRELRVEPGALEVVA